MEEEFKKENNIDLNQIIFLGDKLHPGGNDFPATKVVDCIAVESPKDTLLSLRRIAEFCSSN